MNDTDLAGRPLPLQVTGTVMDAPASRIGAFESERTKPASSKEMFAHGLLLILSEMVQLVIAFVLALFALACCVALAVKANDTFHFMGEKFVTPRVVTEALGGLAAHSVTYLIVRILFAIFAIKLLDLLVRVLQRRARLAERGYPTL